MKQAVAILTNDRGAALIVSVLILASMVLIGIFATKTADTELQIAGNDVQQKIAFYEADGATEFAAQLLEENIACYDFAAGNNQDVDQIRVENASFWQNTLPEETVGETQTEAETETQTEETPAYQLRAFYFPADITDETQPHTSVWVAGRTSYAKGAAIQMAAGYEGKGKGAAGGGVLISYAVSTERVERDGSFAGVSIGWRHVIGTEIDCSYGGN